MTAYLLALTVFTIPAAVVLDWLDRRRFHGGRHER